MRWVVTLLPLVGAAACASGANHELHSFGSSRVNLDEVELEDPTPPPPKKVERKKISVAEHARTYRTPQLCEQAARGMRDFKPNKAWALLLACADREDFTAIDNVLRTPWVEEIKRRHKTGAQLVSQIVANRGGNLKLDLTLVNDRGVQLFELETVMKNARVFRGRYVLMRGKVLDVSSHGSGFRIRLNETSLQAQNIEREATWSRVRDAAREGRNVEAIRRSQRNRRKRTMVVDSLTVSHATNRFVLAFTDKPTDLEQGAERLFLIRFDDAKSTATEDDPNVMTGTAALVASYEPVGEPLDLEQ